MKVITKPLFAALSLQASRTSSINSFQLKQHNGTKSCKTKLCFNFVPKVKNLVLFGVSLSGKEICLSNLDRSVFLVFCCKPFNLGEITLPSVSFNCRLLEQARKSG